jgi:glycosyltransferase involved in cell wall biosynthesis
MRYVWFLREDYLSDTTWMKRQLLKFVVPFIRKWDMEQAQTVDFFIANSKHIQQHIAAIYKRESVCIYPPVQVDKFLLNTQPRKDYYLALGRFVAHKKIDVVIEAFRRMPEHKLVLIGDGHDAPYLKELLLDCPNIVWLGYQHDDELILYMQHAKACIFAAKEDFGIMCVEAQATGTPVLALRYGGYQETVIEGVSGYFFDRQDADAICAAVKTFELHPLNDHERIREHTLQFSAERFRDQFETFIKEALQTYSTQHG